MAAGVPQSKQNHQRKRKPEDLADHKHQNNWKSDPNYRNNESEQSSFTQLKKRVRTPGGGITGTARNFRFREDTAKYLWNLDVNSAHYDPKSRSMRGDPNPNADPEETFYKGDNQYRHSGEAMEFQKLFIHAWERGQGQIHVQAAPSQAELVYKNHMATNLVLSYINNVVSLDASYTWNSCSFAITIHVKFGLQAVMWLDN